MLNAVAEIQTGTQNVQLKKVWGPAKFEMIFINDIKVHEKS